MTQVAQQIRSQISRLSRLEQAELLEFLLEIVDGESHPDAEEAWDREINRRADDVLSGKDKGTPAEEVHRMIRERLEKRK